MSNKNNDNDIDTLLARLREGSAARDALWKERDELLKENVALRDRLKAKQDEVLDREFEMDALRKNTTELESELTAYAQRVSDLIAEKWRLQDRIKELESQQPASDLRERLVCAALTGMLANSEFSHVPEDMGDWAARYADAALAAMRKGEAHGK